MRCNTLFVVALVGLCARATVADAQPLEHGRRLSARLEGPVVEVASAHAITEARLSLRCGFVAGVARCAAQAEWSIVNRSASSASERWGFYGARVGNLSVLARSGAAEAIASGEAEDWDRALRRAEGFSAEEAGWPAWQRGFPDLRRVSIGVQSLPGERQSIRAEAAMQLVRRREPTVTSFESVVVRHPLVSRRVPVEQYDVDWLCSGVGPGPSVERASVEVEVPRGWRVELRGVRPGDDSGDPTVGAILPATQSGAAQQRERWTVRFSPRERGVVRVAVTLVPPAPVLRRGGPLLAVGVSVDQLSQPRFFTRLGYEFGLGPALLWANTIETNWIDSVALASVVELASPWIVGAPWLVPLSVGVGGALRLPTVEPSIRLQAAAQVVFVGLVAHVDVRPEPRWLREWGVALRGSL
jgi:hypothetical protein